MNNGDSTLGQLYEQAIAIQHLIQDQGIAEAMLRFTEAYEREVFAKPEELCAKVDKVSTGGISLKKEEE